MKDQFDWFVGEEDEEAVPLRSGSGRWLARSLWFLLITAVITATLLTSWQVGRKRLEQTEADAVTAVQALLDLEHAAFRRGDGDLYFSFYGNDPAWISAQLQPQNMAAARAGFQVTRAEPHDDFIWANLSWITNQRNYQRIAFFQQQNGQLTHAPTAPDYWGSWTSYDEPWGTLILTERDELWTDEIAGFITETVTEICEMACVDGRTPFILHLANDYSDTAVPNQLRIPSPRLIALDENGQPAGIFWETLRQRLEARLSPVTIRFALPPTELPGVHLVTYDQAAADFMAANPGIIIELIKLETLPDDLAQLAQYDGAAVKPTAAMIAAGLVHDLTNLASSDPSFNLADFYEPIWQGAFWQDRLWFIPQSAALPLVFYDVTAFQQAQQPEPMLFWTWDEMAALQETVVTAQPDASFIAWSTMDVNRDLLFSYAFHQQKECTAVPTTDKSTTNQDSITDLALIGRSTTSCDGPLQPQSVAAALRWYSQMIHDDRMPDFSQFTAAEREQAATNWLSARRRAVTWIEEPVFYEYHFLLDPIGVVPFPGSDSVEGVTPLYVEGNFISGLSQRPLAVWQWLKFLSYQPPIGRYRYVPARPSVAARANYWASLPRPLADPMRTTFSFSHPITIGDQVHFSWDQVTAVTTHQLTPDEAARRPAPIPWFSPP
jgi:ABC-type glycerol-3-phosphate transport system substrate-binding protein